MTTVGLTFGSFVTLYMYTAVQWCLNSVGQLGPIKTSVDRPTDEFSSSSLGVIKDVSP